MTDEAKHGPSLDAAEYRRLWGLCQESRLAACLRAETAEARVQALEAQREQLRLWVADSYAAWVKGKPMSAIDWDDLREALGVERMSP